MQNQIISFSSISICCLLRTTQVYHIQCLWLMLSAAVFFFYPIATLSSIFNPQNKGGIPVVKPCAPEPFHCSTELSLFESAGVIWSEVLCFQDGELHMRIWGLLEQHCHNKNEFGCDSFHYGKADEFLSPFVKIKHFCLAPKKKIIPPFEMQIWYFAIQLNFSASQIDCNCYSIS